MNAMADLWGSGSLIGVSTVEQDAGPLKVPALFVCPVAAISVQEYGRLVRPLLLCIQGHS